MAKRRKCHWVDKGRPGKRGGRVLSKGRTAIIASKTPRGPTTWADFDPGRK